MMLTTSSEGRLIAGFADRFNSAETLLLASAARSDGPENRLWVELRQPHADLRSQLMNTLFVCFLNDELGATAIEYGPDCRRHLGCHHRPRERPRHQAQIMFASVSSQLN